MTILAQHDVGRFYVAMSNRGFQAVKMCDRASNLKAQKIYAIGTMQINMMLLYSDPTFKFSMNSN